MPLPWCFSSGSEIPFIMSLIFPESPALPMLLKESIRIDLYKRMQLLRLKATDVSTRDILLSTAKMGEVNKAVSGVVHLKGTIKAGKSGQESSWMIEDMVHVQVSGNIYSA